MCVILLTFYFFIRIIKKHIRYTLIEIEHIIRQVKSVLSCRLRR